jgi:hypothetical protein
VQLQRGIAAGSASADDHDFRGHHLHLETTGTGFGGRELITAPYRFTGLFLHHAVLKCANGRAA